MSRHSTPTSENTDTLTANLFKDPSVDAQKAERKFYTPKSEASGTASQPASQQSIPRPTVHETAEEVPNPTTPVGQARFTSSDHTFSLNMPQSNTPEVNNTSCVSASCVSRVMTNPYVKVFAMGYIAMLALAYLVMGGFYADGKWRHTNAGDDFVKSLTSLLPSMLKAANDQGNFAILAIGFAVTTGLAATGGLFLKNKCCPAKDETSEATETSSLLTMNN